MLYKVGDKVLIKSLKWYNENKNEYGDIIMKPLRFHKRMVQYCGQIMTIKTVFSDSYRMEEDSIHSGGDFWSEEMIEGLAVSDKQVSNVNQTINKIVSVHFQDQNYEDEVELILGNYELKKEGDRVFAVKKTPKYPTNLKEACYTLNMFGALNGVYDVNYKRDVLETFRGLLICRDAYRKISGYKEINGPKWTIRNVGGVIEKGYDDGSINCILSFNSMEVRDRFYTTYENDIEKCKEFL